VPFWAMQDLPQPGAQRRFGVATRPSRKTSNNLRLVRGGVGVESGPAIDFQLIVEHSPSLVVLTDPDGVVQYVNPRFCEVTGYTSAEAVGRRIHELGEISAEQAIDIWLTVGSGKPWRGEFEAPKKSGERYWVSSTISPVTAADGRLCNYLAVNIDITERRRAEEALRASEQRFRAIVETSREMIWSMDTSSTLTYANPAVERVVGHDGESLIGKDCRWLLHPEDAAKYDDTFGKALAAGRGWRKAVARWRHADGTYRYVESSGVPMVDDSGTIVGFSGSAQDITERVEAEKALRASEERLRTLLYNTPIILFAWDREGRFVASEGKGLEALGRSPGQVVGQHITELYPPGTAIHENFLKALSGQVVVDDVEVRDRWFTASSAPLRSAGGEIIGVIGVALDVTERRRAEEALRAGEERLRLALDHAQMSAWEWDIQRNEISDSAGPGGPLAADPGPLTYEGFLERVHEADRMPVARAIVDSAKEGVDFNAEFRINWPDGTMHWVVANGAITRDARGRPHRLFGIAVDITAHKIAEEALLESQAHLHLALESGGMRSWSWEIERSGTVRLSGQEAFLKFVHELDREAVGEAIRRSLEEGNTFKSEFRFEAADGSMRWIGCRAIVVRDDQGRPAQLVGVAADISERKSAEELLRESEERYRALYQDNPSMYFTVADDGTVLSVNQFGAEQLGYTPGELVGASVFEVFHRADRAAVRRQLSFLAGAPGAVRSWEFRKVRKDGEVIWVREIVRATQDGKGGTVFLVVCEDITERRRMEDAMQSLREELERRADRAMAQGNTYGLSFREMTVVELVAGGKSDKEIGVVLGIRPMTVSKHVANVLKKMGAASRAEAGVRALREGIIN